MSDDTRLAIGLAAIRITMVLLFAPWVAAKLMNPESIQHVFAKYYFVQNLPVTVSYVLGGLQALIVLAFLLGLFKFWTYGAMLVMHTVSTLSTWKQLITPGDGHNVLFWAAVPALAAIFTLFLMRHKDTFLTLKTGK